MKTRWWIMAVAVAVLAVVVVFWTASYRDSQYENEAVNAWTNLQSWLSSVNSEATRKDRDEKQYDVDFTATRNMVQQTKSEVDKLIKLWGTKKAPGKFREFNISFVDLLGKSTAVFQSVIDNTLTWSDKEMNDLAVKIADLTSSQSTAFSSWPAGRKVLIQPDRELLSKATKAFNATHQARKRAAEVERIARANAEEQARQENQRVSGFHNYAVEEMRAIMNEYIQARNYFNTTMDAGQTNPYVFGEQCVAGRNALINRLENLDFPNEFYRETRHLFISGINDAIEAIRIKCRTGNGRSAAARRAASKMRQVQTRLGM